MIDKFSGENLVVHKTIVGEGDSEKEVIQITHLDTGKVDDYTFQEWNEIFEVIMMMDHIIKRDRAVNGSPIHFIGGMMTGPSDD